MRKTYRYPAEYLTGAAFSAKEFLSQQMNQGGGGEEGEKVVKKEDWDVTTCEDIDPITPHY